MGYDHWPGSTLAIEKVQEEISEANSRSMGNTISDATGSGVVRLVDPSLNGKHILCPYFNV